MKVFHIAQGQPIPEWFLDAFQEFVSTMASANFAITSASSTSLQIVAGTNSDQVAIGIAKSGVGAWRYNVATVTASVPGGLGAGTHDIYVTAFGNGPYTGQAGPPSILDSTVYAFGLKLVQTGTFPSGIAGSSEELYRKVGTFTWDGSSITDFRQSVGGASLPKHAAQHNPGGADALNYNSVAGVMLLNGLAGSRPAAASGNANWYYFATDTFAGTLYQNISNVWVALTSGVTHAARHLNGGADAITWTTVNAVGLAGSRPAAASTNAGYTYLATDTNGGTFYTSTGSVWQQAGLGVNQGLTSAQVAAAILLRGTYAAMPAAGSNTNNYYLATDQNGGSLYQSNGTIWIPVGAQMPGALSVMQAMALTLAEGVSAGHGPADIQTDPQLAMKITLSSGWVLTCAAGYALIQGDDNGSQGIYFATTGSVSVTMVTHNPTTNPRWDTIVARWNDPAFTGRTPAGLELAVITGSENAAAAQGSPPNYAGIAALPASCIEIARVLVRVADTTGPISGNINDTRKLAGPAIWGEDSHRYRLGIDGAGVLGVEQVL